MNRVWEVCREEIQAAGDFYCDGQREITQQLAFVLPMLFMRGFSHNELCLRKGRLKGQNEFQRMVPSLVTPFISTSFVSS